MRRRLRLPSPAMAVALVALVAALGGTSYAAITVTSSNVRNNSLTGTDIRNSSITGADVRNRTLTANDFREGALPQGADGARGTDGANGAAGPQGEKGEKGSRGDKGDDATGRWVLVNAAGQIEAQSGGFTVVSGYVANPPGAAATCTSTPARTCRTTASWPRSRCRTSSTRTAAASPAAPRPGRERRVLGRDRGDAVRDRVHGVRPSRRQRDRHVRRQPAAERRPGHRGRHAQAVLRDDRRLGRTGRRGRMSDIERDPAKPTREELPRDRPQRGHRLHRGGDRPRVHAARGPRRQLERAAGARVAVSRRRAPSRARTRRRASPASARR